MKREFVTIILAFLLVSIMSAEERLSGDSVSARILNYYGNVPQEKIYVHTDRGCYAASDTVWFRAYIVDAATNMLSDRSKFVYIELIDNSADTLVSRIKVKADGEGVLANALPLSSRMKSGSYTLGAYTQWMQNFGEDLFFKKQLMVVNPDDSMSPIQPKVRNINAIALDIMPEGGNLLTGQLQRIAYKAVGDDGRGVDVEVRLVDRSGSVIAESVSQHLGMGYMPVCTEAGEELWLEAFSADGHLCRTKLPEPLVSGASLWVNQHNGTVLIQPIVTPDVDIQDIVLALYGAGNMVVKELTDLTPISVRSSELLPGVVNIALIDNKSGRTLAERLIFVRDTNPIKLQSAPRVESEQ